ncbi:MAG: TonB-dependent receptor [Ferruginibacter sp.]
MKSLLSGVTLLFLSVNVFAQIPFNDTAFLQPVEISSVKAADKNPFAKTDLLKEEIRQKNIGQDLPFLLNQTPSVTVNSDAGNGVGYTGIRIRGTDATRINVTLNGIPYNDAESLGTFFVDLPDIASSAGSIQVQRGVGTSANGAGSFGGSINVSTNELIKERNIELNSTAGSYGTFKNTLLFNSGIFAKHVTVDARMSNISSEGYVDRAAVRLSSYYLSTAYSGEKNAVRLNIFTGKEKTYQSWYGINAVTLDTNRTFNSAGTEKPGTPYENETDNYIQTHYQFFYNHRFGKHLTANLAGFLTRGKGYYEQYKAQASLSDYGLPAYGAVTETDLTRRLWLDNYFYGTIFSLKYDRNKTQLIFGGGYNRYEGQHYGEVISAAVQDAVPVNHRWYDRDAQKNDLSAYVKWTQSLNAGFQTFIDLQVRNINYTINGFRDNPSLLVDKQYTFFNPKAGVTFSKNHFRIYASSGRAVKEPNRNDFEAAGTAQPKPEKLHDFEIGAEFKKTGLSGGVNGYYMSYEDQLVLTGKINDVGAYTRTNIPSSYRAGVEIFGSAAINRVLILSGNFTLSRNKVKNFTEYIDDYDNGGQVVKKYGRSDISFSPNLVSAVSLDILPFKNILITLAGKYVGQQFLDNTSDKSRRLKEYYTQDIRTGYTLKGKKIKEVNFYVQVNNVFSKLYEANGYSFSYIYGGSLTTENYFFPMAPVNVLLGVNVRL